MYNGVKVFDVHGHVSAPGNNGAALVGGMLASNTPMRRLSAGIPGFDDDAFRASGKRHADLMDDRNIDVQIIGPRPFLQMGWMQPHLIPSWSRFVNDCHRQAVQPVSRTASSAPRRCRRTATRRT